MQRRKEGRGELIERRKKERKERMERREGWKG